MPTPIRLKAAAGGRGGSWFLLLEGIAELVNRLHPEIEIEVVEGGGVSNQARVGSGELPMAILNPPMTRAALSGNSPFDRAWPGLRIGVANLTASYLHFVVDAGVPLTSLEEWFEQRYPLRIAVDRIGTVDRLVFEITLSLQGVSGAHLEDWGGGGIPAENYHQQLELYRTGKVNALWQFMGIPSPSIAGARNLRPIKVLPLSPGLIDQLAQRGWPASEIPAGAYGSGSGPVPTVSMGTSLGFHFRVPDDLVFAITSAICQHPEQVRRVHPAAADFDPAAAQLNPGGPWHPGAERYFATRRSGL
jgi:hypothetical protein